MMPVASWVVFIWQTGPFFGGWVYSALIKLQMYEAIKWKQTCVGGGCDGNNCGRRTHKWGYKYDSGWQRERHPVLWIQLKCEMAHWSVPVWPQTVFGTDREAAGVADTALFQIAAWSLLASHYYYCTDGKDMYIPSFIMVFFGSNISVINQLPSVLQCLLLVIGTFVKINFQYTLIYLLTF